MSVCCSIRLLFFLLNTSSCSLKNPLPVSHFIFIVDLVFFPPSLLSFSPFSQFLSVRYFQERFHHLSEVLWALTVIVLWLDISKYLRVASWSLDLSLIVLFVTISALFLLYPVCCSSVMHSLLFLCINVCMCMNSGKMYTGYCRERWIWSYCWTWRKDFDKWITRFCSEDPPWSSLCPSVWAA